MNTRRDPLKVGLRALFALAALLLASCSGDPDTTELVLEESVAPRATTEPPPAALPVTGRDPAKYAYSSPMSADGWYSAAPSEQASVDKLRPLPDDDGDLPDPLPPLSVSVSASNSTSVTLRLTCGEGGDFYRKKDGTSVWSRLGACTSGTRTDSNVQQGQRYCYQVRSAGRSSAQACAQILYEPYAFTTPHHSRGASEAMLERFDWQKTDAVYAGTASAPALWYMSVLTDFEGDAYALRALGIHVQSTPLFPEEQSGWLPDDDVVELDGALAGRWVYALVPGALYNDVRTQMREQVASGRTPSFRAFVFRQAPVSAARLWPTSSTPSPLKVDYVGSMGVSYNGIQRCQVVDGLRLCSQEQALLGWLLRKAYDLVVDFVDTVVEGVRQLIGAVAKLIKGEVTLTLRLRFANTDVGFSGPLVSAWRRGPPDLSGLRVQASQGLALFKGETDAAGVVKIKVAKGWSGKICLELENSRVSFTAGWAEAMACVGDFPSLSSDRTIDMDVNHARANAFVVMTDAADYVKTVLGYSMPKVKVLVGWAAGKAGGEQGQSFAPCLGMAPALSTSVIDAGLYVLFPPLVIASSLAEAFYSVDIILKDEGLASRGVAAHEYGHTVMCAMMRKAGTIASEIALLDILKGYMIGNRTDVSKEQTYLTEGFADFLALQVVGGTNYVQPALGPSVASQHLNYCPAASACYETNQPPAASDWKGQVRRTVSLLQDAFDNSSVPGNRPNDGSHWASTASGLLLSAANDSSTADEPFALVSGDMLKIYENWESRGNTLREASFWGGLADVLISKRHTKAQICALFSAHHPSGTCPAFVDSLVELPPLPPTPPPSEPSCYQACIEECRESMLMSQCVPFCRADCEEV
jgi:hypothetical protein